MEKDTDRFYSRALHVLDPDERDDTDFLYPSGRELAEGLDERVANAIVWVDMVRAFRACIPELLPLELPVFWRSLTAPPAGSSLRPSPGSS